MSDFDDYFDERNSGSGQASSAPQNPQAQQPPEAPQEPTAPASASAAAESAGNSTVVEPPKKKSRKGCIWTWIILILLVALGVTCWIRYFNPYITDARVSGYITSIDRRGVIFKTYEGQMISESSLTDTTRIYSRDFTFSVQAPEVIKRLQELQGTGRPITLIYERFYASLPWRGASPCVVTGIVDTPVDTRAETPAPNTVAPTPVTPADTATSPASAKSLGSI